MEGILIPLAAFAMVAAIVIVPRYFRSQEKMRLQEMLKASIEKGQPLPPEVVQAISTEVKPPATPERDLRRGIIWICAGVGLAVFGMILGYEEPDATTHILAFSALPAFIGLAYVVVALMGRSRK